MKVDLAIYSHILDVSGWCMSVTLMLGINWISVLVQIGKVFVNQL